jgi:hypothetical protein
MSRKARDNANVVPEPSGGHEVIPVEGPTASPEIEHAPAYRQDKPCYPQGLDVAAVRVPSARSQGSEQGYRLDDPLDAKLGYDPNQSARPAPPRDTNFKMPHDEAEPAGEERD